MLQIMSTARHDTPRLGTLTSTVAIQAGDDSPEQLSLLTTADTPLQFRLDDRTRRRGLANIALIRRQLAELAARHDSTDGLVQAPSQPAQAAPAASPAPAAERRSAA